MRMIANAILVHETRARKMYAPHPKPRPGAGFPVSSLRSTVTPGFVAANFTK